MNSAPAMSWNWSAADFVAIATAIVYTATALFLRPEKRKLEDIGNCIPIGISLGPLLMIVLDLLAQLTGLFRVSWLQLVLTEGRVVMWWAAAISTLRLVWPLFPTSRA